MIIWAFASRNAAATSAVLDLLMLTSSPQRIGRTEREVIPDYHWSMRLLICDRSLATSADGWPVQPCLIIAASRRILSTQPSPA